VVGNYLKGNKPPAFDLLYWNSDATNLPGPFLAWYLRNMYLENNLRVPGKLEMCGVKADLGRVDMPAFIYASREDHIVPWKSAYQSRKLLGGETTFVLGASGHIAGVINPGGEEQAQPLAERQHHRERRRMVRHRDRGQGQLVAGVGQVAQGPRRRRSSGARETRQQGLPARRAGAGKLRQGKGMNEPAGICAGRGFRRDNASPDPTIIERRKNAASGTGNGRNGRSRRGHLYQAGGAGLQGRDHLQPEQHQGQRMAAHHERHGLRLQGLSLRRRRFRFLQGLRAQVAKDVGPVEVLVNNAGITRDMTFKKMTKADWDAVIHTNLDSAFNMTKQVMDGMMERGWGRVINISSVNGQKGAFGQTNYSAAKAGMHGFTKALALEVAKKGVTVNTISPGYIGTKMVMAIPQEVLDSKILPQIAQSRLGKPEEVAGLVAYLSSEEAAFVTGANISINGGQHMY
jgi:acetoacetyl-CoA reductase